MHRSTPRCVSFLSAFAHLRALHSFPTRRSSDLARRASDAVAGFADTLREKDVDELYDNVRQAVRKSPGIAIGIAAVVGFTLVRLVKAGLEDESGRDGRSSGDA